jgi:hypothetical protein
MLLIALVMSEALAVFPLNRLVSLLVSADREDVGEFGPSVVFSTLLFPDWDNTCAKAFTPIVRGAGGELFVTFVGK